MSETVEQKRERGLATIGDMMGSQFADALRTASTSGKFGSAISQMALEFSFADSWSRDGLARKERSLVILGALIALRQTKELKNHVKIGIANGLTVREIEEVLIQATSYVGFPAIATATTAVIEALREIGKDPDVQTSEEKGLL
jgi:4-carboxymuconolactone decarboxylase